MWAVKRWTRSWRQLLQLERCILTCHNNHFWTVVLKLLFCMVEALRFPLVIGCCAWHSGSSSRVTCQKLIFCRYRCWYRWTGTTGLSAHFWMVSRQGHEGIEVSFVTSQGPSSSLLQNVGWMLDLSDPSACLKVRKILANFCLSWDSSL